MAVKPGFKQSENWVIPVNWEIQDIESLMLSVSSGRSLDKNKLGIYPVYGSTGILGYSDKYEYSGQAILIARVGANAGKVNVVHGQYGLTDNTIIVKLSAKVCFDYIRRQLEALNINRLVFGSGQPLVTGTQIRELTIPLPPTLAEQESIAEALNDADALIESLEQLIAKKHLIKQGVMQELLTGRRRLPGFSGEWNYCVLGDLGDFLKGKGIKKNEVAPNGLPCIRYGEIYTHYNNYIKDFISFIPRDISKNCQRIFKGDLLFTGSGETAEEIGKCVTFLEGEEAYAGGDIIILRTRNQEPLFLAYLLNHSSLSAQKIRMAQGDAIVHISAQKLGRLRLHLPSRHEQVAIAEVIKNIDCEIDELIEKLKKINLLKQGMMQELLTGRIRLV